MSNDWVRDENIGEVCETLARKLAVMDPPESLDPDDVLADVWRAVRDRATVALSMLASIENGEGFYKVNDRYDRMDAVMDLDGLESNPDGLMDALRRLAFGA